MHSKSLEKLKWREYAIGDGYWCVITPAAFNFNVLCDFMHLLFYSNM